MSLAPSDPEPPAAPAAADRFRPPRRRAVRLALALAPAVLALAWWGGFWSEVNDSVLVRVPILDESYYLRRAAAIEAGQWLPREPFLMSPLYPYLVAATRSGRELDARGVAVGPPPAGIRMLQATLWAGTVVILVLAGRRLLPRWAAPLPAVLFALYRPAAIYAATILVEVPLTFLAAAALHLLSRGAGAGGRIGRSAVAAGACLGLAALLRFHLVLLLPLGWWALARSPGAPVGARRRRLAAFTAAALLPVLLVLAVNGVLAGRAAGPSSNAGLNLYIGNGPQADGLYHTLAEFDAAEDPSGAAFLSRRLQRPVSGPAEADRIWLGLALREIGGRPWRAAGLWLRKAWLHFVGREIPQVTPLSAWAAEARLLGLLVVPYGLLAAGGLAGLFLVGWRDPRWRLWSAAVLLLVGAQSLFFVTSRYRLVIVPALCLLAAGAVAGLARLPRRRLLPAAALLVGAGLFVLPWGLGAELRQWEALGLASEAVRWEHLGGPQDLARAEGLYRHAADLDPSQPLVHRSLARTLVRRGDPAAAEKALAEGSLRAVPAWPLQRDLVVMLLERGDLDGALARLTPYLRERPDDSEMLHNYSVALARTGRLEAAIEAARRLVRLAPSDPQGHLDLGVLLARAGRDREAEQAFRDGLAADPGHAGLLQNLRRLQAPAKVSPPSRVQ